MVDKIVLDDNLRSKLNGLNETIEVCSPDGKTVGQFVPQKEYMRLVCAEVTIEELEEAMKDLSGGCTTDELLASLGE